MTEPKPMFERDFLECLVKDQRGEVFAGAYEVEQDDGGSCMFLVTDCDVYTKIEGAEHVAAIEVGEQRLVSVREYFGTHFSMTAALAKTENVMRYCVGNGVRRDKVN